jgi:hypothetical protein
MKFSYEAVALFGTSRCDIVHCYFLVCFLWFPLFSSFQCLVLLEVSLHGMTGYHPAADGQLLPRPTIALVPFPQLPVAPYG